MGESTDDSDYSDETLEAKERFDDQKKNEFGGDKTNITQDPRKSLDFADDAILSNIREAKYIADQNKILADRVNITGDDKFAQEQYNIDEFGYNPNESRINVGAGDIFGLRDSIEKQLASGGRPVFNPDGQIVGVMGSMRDAPVFGALPSVISNIFPDNQVYTGLAEFDPNRQEFDDGDNTTGDTTPPVMNQMTGKSQCPDGYVFDNQLQACRLKTRTDDQLGTPKDPPDGGQMFTRNYSLLNQTPMNVPQGFDYNAMNTNFMNRFGTRPSIFKRPPNLLGFTPFGG